MDGPAEIVDHDAAGPVPVRTADKRRAGVREDFLKALDGTIDEFASDIGISDEELIETMYAKIADIRQSVRRLEGVAS